MQHLVWSSIHFAKDRGGGVGVLIRLGWKLKCRQSPYRSSNFLPSASLDVIRRSSDSCIATQLVWRESSFNWMIGEHGGVVGAIIGAL